MSEPSPLQSGVFGACPRCAAPTLFNGPVHFAGHCSSCDLDYAGFNVGDGLAAFLTLIIGALLVALALTVELTIAPPFRVHILLWALFIAAAMVFGLRVGKGVLIAFEYRNAAREGKIREDKTTSPDTGAGHRRMRVPIVPTVFVLVAMAAMAGLGIWQLQRKVEKEALLERYEAASALPPIAWPETADMDLLFRRATGYCLEPTGWRAIAGQNRAGEVGWRHIAACRTGGGEGSGMQVVMGWSRSPESPGDWVGGEVTGIITLDPEYGLRLVAEDPTSGLAAVARPSPEDIPDNHLLYAIQWFFFAAAAGIIYILALRRRLSE